MTEARPGVALRGPGYALTSSKEVSEGLDPRSR
jgi:hypothetical protein